LAKLALSVSSTGDYRPFGPVLGDNTGPALQALVHGRLAEFVTHQPAIGLTSLLLRAPFVALASLLHGGSLLGYQLGALACMLPFGALIWWLAASPWLDGSRLSAPGWLIGLAGAALLLFSPVVPAVLVAGHPEGLLTATLAVSSVLAAMRGRQRTAAILLGLALGSKEWAVIAILPVLVALPGRRRQAAAIAAAVAFVTAATLPLLDPTAFFRTIHAEGGLQHVVNPLSTWWPLSAPIHIQVGTTSARRMPFGLSRSGASLILLGVVLPILGANWLRAVRRGYRADALALLALLGAARIFCDSTHLEYYDEALLIPLVVWETVGLRRLPLVAAAVTGAVGIVPLIADGISPALLDACWLAGSYGLLHYMTRRAFFTEVAEPVPAGRAVAWNDLPSPVGET
jgi:hypothetical protein